MKYFSLAFIIVFTVLSACATSIEEHKTQEITTTTPDIGTSTPIKSLTLTNTPAPMNTPGPLMLQVGGNGEYQSISQAITAARNGSVIQIAQGVYNENIVIISLKDILIQGGWDENFLVKSNDSTLTEINGRAQDSVLRISLGSELNGHISLEGLMFRNGRAEQGGGIKIVSAGPNVTVELENSTISHNMSNDRGGGIYILSRGPDAMLNVSITNCVIMENSTNNEGGGFRAEVHEGGMAKLSLVGNRIVSNSVATDQGGASDGGGGALYASQSGSLTVEMANNIFAENVAGFGGALWGYAWGDDGLLDVVLANNIIAHNEGGYGGAIMIGSGQTEPVFSKPGGRVIWAMSNNTITGNVGVNGTGAVHLHSGSTFGDGGEISFISHNDIIWNNKDPYSKAIMVIVEPGKIGSTVAEFNYSLLRSIDKSGTGVFTLSNIIWVNPLLDTAPDGLFRLMDNSPAIDAGDPNMEYNDGAIPPGQGTERADLGAYGGPGNGLWPWNVYYLNFTPPNPG